MAQRQTVRNIDGVTHIVVKKSAWQRLKLWAQKSRYAPLVFLGVAIILVGGATLLWRAHTKPDANSDARQLTSALSKHMILPQNEQPLIATVTDRTALKTPFLREANNGDRIIIYEKAKRVIIYRPSVDRIVDIGPVELNNIPKVNGQ